MHSYCLDFVKSNAKKTLPQIDFAKQPLSSLLPSHDFRLPTPLSLFCPGPCTLWSCCSTLTSLSLLYMFINFLGELQSEEIFVFDRNKNSVMSLVLCW